MNLLRPEMKDALILAPTGRDASVATNILTSYGLSSEVCESVEDCFKIFASAYSMVVTEEALLHSNREQLAEWIEAQPPWSDFPIVLLTTKEGGPPDARLSFLAEYAVTLERPFHPESLVAAVRAAVRARRRQLEVKVLLDERDESNQRQKLLIKELHHRVKNTLANVQAVLGATARSTSSVEDFQRSFSGRLHALARTHSFLTDDYWQTASLHKMLQAELAPYATDGRVELCGPDILLNADHAVPLGMAFHELATNASKYGSLSVPTGRLRVAWTATPIEGGEELLLGWTEQGGPPAKDTGRKGFGSLLFERVLSVQVAAKFSMDFAPEGLIVTLSLPVKRGRLVPAYHA